MSVAAIWGTAVGFMELLDSVVIETCQGRVIVLKKETFEYLYLKLDDFTAALKEDCITYTIYQPNTPLCSYPDWFIEAYDNGYIYEEDGYDSFIFYNKYGDVVMSPGSVILRNYMGQLLYMERYQFDKYYDTLGECI